MNPLEKNLYVISNGQHKATSSDMFLAGTLFIVALLFVPFAGLLVISKNIHNAIPAKAFTVSTFADIAGIASLYKVCGFLKQDNIKKFRYGLISIFFFGLLFLFLQYIGWHKMLLHDINEFTGVIVLIAIVHAFHFIPALTLLSILFIKVLKIESSAEFYIYNLNPAKRFFIKLVFTYWKFISLLWVALYLLILVVW